LAFVVSSLVFFQAEDGIRDGHVTGVQTCALPISDLFIDAELRAEADDLDVEILVNRLELFAQRHEMVGAAHQAPKQAGQFCDERSEERRVGKEWRSRGRTEDEKKKAEGRGGERAG